MLEGISIDLETSMWSTVVLQSRQYETYILIPQKIHELTKSSPDTPERTLKSTQNEYRTDVAIHDASCSYMEILRKKIPRLLVEY